VEATRLVSESARVDDPVRVTVVGVEGEGRIEGVESSMLSVPHWDLAVRKDKAE
jgi:hypothetical protein